MRVKYFYPDENGDIKFTREELEKLLNDVYDEGREDGRKEGHISTPVIIPSYPTYYNTPTWDYTKVYCTDDNSIGRTILDIERI